MMDKILYTIGHSNHSIETFVNLLQKYNITALGDVRSHPYSRYVSQYSYESLKQALTTAGITYVFLGKELGVRSSNPTCYIQGKVQYDLLAKEPLFKQGVIRVKQGMEHYTLALMCAEKDPLECHRSILISRHLFEEQISVQHIHANGVLESHRALEERLLKVCKISKDDMFKTPEQCIAEAYQIQGERIAYQDKKMEELEIAA